MSPMLVKEGESAKTATHTAIQQSVEGTGAGGRASNDQKLVIRGAVRQWSNTQPNGKLVAKWRPPFDEKRGLALFHEGAQAGANLAQVLAHSIFVGSRRDT